MEIIDNFFSEEEFKQYDQITHPEMFPFSITNATAYKDKIDNISYNHVLYRNGSVYSDFFKPLVFPIIEKIRVPVLLRAKVSGYPKGDKLTNYNFHLDRNDEHKNAILYLNTNDGFTLFKNGDKVESVANRLLIFDGSLEHASTNCTDAWSRFILNINFID